MLIENHAISAKNHGRNDELVCRAVVSTWLRIATALLLLLVPKLSLAQATATILGTVKDSSGAVVPQAKVTIINTDTSDTRTSTTGDDGSYRFPALLTGHYSLKVEKEGFKTETRTGLNLEVAQDFVANSVLEVGSSTQQVTVTGEAPVVNTTDSALGLTVNEQRMANLPLNGRNYQDLTYMQAGVVNNTNMTASSAQGGLHGTFFVSDGGQLRMNLYTLDGANLTDTRGGGPSSEAGTTLGIAGIKEFKVVTGTFDASYGNEGGSQIVMVSRGGTNQFHGEAFEYFRNDALDAANYFDKPVAANNFERIVPFKRNNFGGAVGGPIKKQKTFFYAAYEGLRQRLGVTIIDTVPGAGCHGPSGNNTSVVTSAACPQLGAGAPSVTISPVMQGILSLYPAPNLPNNQFTFPLINPMQVDWGQIRVDQNISAADTLFVRYTTDKSSASVGNFSVGVAAGVGFPQFSENLTSHDQYVTISESHIFSPTVLNQFRLSYSRAEYFDYNTYPVNSYSPNGVAGVTGPLFTMVPGFPVGSVSLSGFSGNGPLGSNPQNSNLNTYILSDDLFYTKGKHALRFGIELNRVNMPFHQGSDAGSITFTTLSGFLQGIAGSYQATQGGASANHYRNDWWWVPGFYAQDDWRVLPRLTLNLGLRYEFMSSLVESNGINVGLPNRLIDTTTTIGRQFAPFSKTHFQPRVGFAWDATGDGKTAVRGGFGQYYDFNMTNQLITGKTSEPPYDGQLTHTSTTTPITLPLTFFPTDVVAVTMPDYYLQQPYLLKWNLTVERQLPARVGLQVAYIGTRGVHLGRTMDGNAPIGTVVNDFPYFSGTESRPNPHFSNLSMFSSTGSSNYNALYVTVSKSVSHGLEFQTTYTYSKFLDDVANQYSGDCSGSPGMGTGDYFGPLSQKFTYGPACTDVTHVLHFNALYHIPNVNSNNFAAKLAHGWWMGTIWSVQGGFPFTPLVGTNRSQSQVQKTQADYVNTATPADAAFCQANPSSCKYTPVPFNRHTVITHNPAQWYNPNMFTMASMTTGAGNGIVCTSSTCGGTGTTWGTLGNASKGLLRGPGLFNADFSLNKDTRLAFLGEQGNLEFRAEFFNIFNHPNFNMPNGTTFSGSTKDFSPYSEGLGSSAGVISSTSTTSRQVQFALRVVF
jgi:hypothetical protein